MNIVLASTSPRRQDLLRLAHIEFDVLAVAVDERAHQDETALAYIERMVLAKSQAACAKLSTSTPTLVLTADTIGVLDGVVLTKPNNRQDAFDMWRRMSGRTHSVWTAVQGVLLVAGEVVWQGQKRECTEVTFLPLSDEMMAYYWQTGEPQDKAGAYGIQGFGATWVQKIDGDYSNVVGLPLPATLALINGAQAALSQYQVTPSQCNDISQ